MSTASTSATKEEIIIGILAGTDRRLKQWCVRPHPTKPGFTLYSYTLNAVDLPVADEMDLSLQFGADYHAKDAADRNNAIEKLKLLKAEGFIAPYLQIAPTADQLAAVSQMPRFAFNDQVIDSNESRWLELSNKLADRSMAFWWNHAGDYGIRKCVENMHFFHDRYPSAGVAEMHQNLNRFYAQAVIVHICCGLNLGDTPSAQLVSELQVSNNWLTHPLYNVANAILYHFL